jgi:hypothetical protein
VAVQPNPLRRSLHLLTAFALVLSQVMLLSIPAAMGAPVVVVNSTGDLGDSNVGDGVCDTGDTLNGSSTPECTLRAAIEEANASSVDEITFDMPISASPYVIKPASVLPWITATVSIDGTTQTGFTGTPIVTLDGSSTPTSTGGTDGLLLESDGSTVRGLVVRDFEDDGIEIHGDANTVVGNHIFGNDSGVLIENGTDNVVGGLSAADRNVISDNDNGGVAITGGDRALIRGNYIGVDTDADSALANQGHGIDIYGTTIDAVIGPGNVISGNTGDGVRVDGAGSTATISGNYIGINTDGTSALANGGNGVSVSDVAGAVEIGGAGAGEGNVISGNTGHGVNLEYGAGVVTIHNNRIGTNASGATAIGNGEDGIHADSDSVVIEDNQVSGNGVDGLRIERLDAVIRGNLIGTDSAGTGGIPNGDDGVDTGSGTAGTVIGGVDVGDGNVIAFNTDEGISLREYDSTTAAILSNSIFGNGGLGIDLKEVGSTPDGPTANDVGDLDDGSNDLLNYPVITSAQTAGNTVYVDFDLDAPAGWHRIEFFTNPSGVDPSGYGEGELFVSSVEVYHDGSGVLSFSHSFAGSAGDDLSATTTYCPDEDCPTYLETSEFSATEEIVVGNEAPLLDPIADPTVDEGTQVSFTAVATDPDTSDTLTFSLTGAPAGASINPDTGVFTWTPTEAQGPGSYNFGVVVTDDGTPANLSDTQPVTITVNEVNQAPVLDPIGNKTVDELDTLTFKATASDDDLPANTLTYSMTGAPTGASIDLTTGEFTWTPTEDQGPGTYNLDVTVTDNSTPTPLTDSQTITITVNEVNTAPVVTNPGDQSNDESDSVNLNIGTVDADLPANTLTYTASALPPGLNINPSTGVITGTIQFNGAESSPYATTVTVTDDGTPSLATQTSFTWTIANVNNPPVLDPIADPTVDEGTQVSFTAVATDPDTSDTLTYSLTGAPTGASINPNTGVFTWTPTEAQGPGSYTFDVVVTDDGTPANLSDSQTITITVNEVNHPPVTSDDAAITTEDTPIVIDVLANDIDEDGHRLTISSLGSPIVGLVRVTDDQKIRFDPSLNFHGLVSFAYVVSDGYTTATGTVRVEVESVNDRPVAVNDSFHLTEYVPTELAVLDNDFDADGDPLSLTLKSEPEVGTVTIANGQLVYHPVNGYTGSVTFSYVARDPHGASSEASVKVIIGDEVLIGARDRARDLGVDFVPFKPPEPAPPAGANSIDLNGISLLAESFFQTVGSLRIPLGFLGLTVAMVVGLGAATEVPALVLGARRRHWAVVRLSRSQRLPAYSEPGGRKVVYNYDPTADGIVSVGKTRVVGNTEWLPVDTPNGQGWIYRKYLTEQVDLQAFTEDRRPVRLVHELARRLQRGKSLRNLISDQGLIVALTGSPSRIPPDQLASLMGDDRLRHLPNIGRTPGTPSEFHLAVAEPFLEAYQATPEISAYRAHSRSALIPTECWNFPYMALGNVDGVQPWLVFFEYRKGRAWIAGIGIDE